MLNPAPLFIAACEAELRALKPGNVHVHAAGHGMTVRDFRRSAAVAAAPLCRPGAPLGARILDAVRATRAAVGQNTNLGILLLCAPVAAAAEAGGELRPALARALTAATVRDAEDTFQAIRLAAPGGLGSAAAHDVQAPATVTLRAAMCAAADADMIARQYATEYADIFDAGLPVWRAAHARTAAHAHALDWAIVDLYLLFLALRPDTHVARKHGAARAAALQQAACAMRERFTLLADPCDAAPALLAWDTALKADGINPGTSADLTVATMFVDAVESSLRGRGVDGSFRPPLPAGTPAGRLALQDPPAAAQASPHA